MPFMKWPLAAWPRSGSIVSRSAIVSRSGSIVSLTAIASLALVLAACGESQAPTPQGSAEERPSEGTSERGGAEEGPRPAATGETPDALPNALLFAYSQFPVENGRAGATPGPARLEILRREGGEWHTTVLEDPESNVFHKALVLDPAEGEPGILTAGGMGAAIKLWRRQGDRWEAQTLWQTEFGGARNRMRDVEVADLFGDGRPALAVATHDQGVVAVLRQQADGAWAVTELDREANTFVHEIEIGDLNGDGTLEIYATPSEPNTLEGTEQRGHVVRYVPRANEGRTVVADLGNRHAKEIWVGDVDGDGRDELYVASDNEGELRRYAWVEGRVQREVLVSGRVPRSMMTFNIMPIPASMLR